jgi:tetratricopeptide (TPR) repeat protein
MKTKPTIMLIIVLLAGVTGLAFGQDLALRFQCSFIGAEGIRAASHFNQIGVNAMSEDRVDEAISAYTCAIRAEPSYYAPYYNRGIVYRNQGNYELASQDFYLAMDYAENDLPELYLSLAITYDLMDDTTGAFTYYNQYLEVVNEPIAWVSLRVEELYQ